MSLLGRFVPWDVLSLGRFVPGTFCPWDVLSLGTFCPWDVLSLGRFVLGRFVLGRFVLGRFVCASEELLQTYLFYSGFSESLQSINFFTTSADQSILTVLAVN